MKPQQQNANLDIPYFLLPSSYDSLQQGCYYSPSFQCSNNKNLLNKSPCYNKCQTKKAPLPRAQIKNAKQSFWNPFKNFSLYIYLIYIYNIY